MIVLLLLAATPAASPGVPVEVVKEADLRALAEESYRSGVEARADAAKARPLFARAAEAYERFWTVGYKNPSIARNLGQAHYLAGDLARSIHAYRRGLQRAPHDRDLRAGLAFAREQVPYPLTGNLAESARPREQWSALRYAPADAFRGIAAGLYLLGFLAFARAWITRRPFWWSAVGVLFALAAAAGTWTWWEEKRLAADNRQPLVIVAGGGAGLHRGNGSEYPLRVSDRLPEGVELRVVGARGGWLQVQLTGGEIGWLEAARVIQVSD